MVVPSIGYEEFIRTKHTVDSDLSARVTEFWQMSAETLASGQTTDLERWARLHSVFRRYIYASAALTTVDGAVLFTRDLRSLGFAAEIIVDDATAAAAPQVLTDAKTGQAQVSQDASLFGGTRHRSAFRLCKALPNSLAFVVSQDGDLSVFYSVPERVFAWGSLEPR